MTNLFSDPTILQNKIPLSPAAKEFQDYLTDFSQRSVLFMDIMRKRGNQAVEMSSNNGATVLSFDFEILIDGATFSRPINYWLAKMQAPAGVVTDDKKRPFVIQDPRAGQSPGIGGMKKDSEIGDALKNGHPVYFVGFNAAPIEGQTYEDVIKGQVAFYEKIAELHPEEIDIRGLITALGEKYSIPIYAPYMVHHSIHKSYCVTEKLFQSKRVIEKEKPFILNEFTITPFPVSHDATDNVGYTIEYGDKRFAFATDLGCVGPAASEHLKAADYMVFEANYDEMMLDQGTYPTYLKNRIKSDTGHLSNFECAKFLAQNYNPSLQYIFLCHLSRENNMPNIAYETVQSLLEEQNIQIDKDVKLVVLNRFTPSELYIFE